MNGVAKVRLVAVGVWHEAVDGPIALQIHRIVLNAHRVGLLVEHDVTACVMNGEIKCSARIMDGFAPREVSRRAGENKKAIEVAHIVGERLLVLVVVRLYDVLVEQPK